MKHWTEDFDDDTDEPLVRPYTITGGRTATQRDDLTLITMVSAAAPAPPSRRELRKLQPEHHTLLDLCRRPLAVAELASALHLPVSLTKILIEDLIEAGHLRAQPPLAFAQESRLPDMTILKAVRDGLRNL
ncbi:DUF742 domain-containing protein [Nonomuraea gerenzanensis]|uniref:Regulatory system-9 n=1 Tax=Nonomuraea gerenzanensis TaxID=93944 RepID=A0A1M4EAL1_9ACTN|nr:DUF742 domain-containing protein [Nonomuraea gerenzanensis]UBU18158.1 DUF742 domain-containing protein [Nonomuraea gerenzanensis]SBO95969.1 regulatory system-9 [Nonomuraea gerenzanensis]